MGTLTFIFLIMGSDVRDGSAWVVTPMPSMEVCQQVLADVKQHGRLSDDFPIPPSGGYCKEVKGK